MDDLMGAETPSTSNVEPHGGRRNGCASPCHVCRVMRAIGRRWDIRAARSVRQTNGQRCGRTDREAVDPPHGAARLHIRGASQKRFGRHGDGGAHERHARTRVRAMPERQVRLRAIEVETVGVDESGGIVVGGIQAEDYGVAGADVRFTDAHVFARLPEHGPRRSRVSQQLPHGVRADTVGSTQDPCRLRVVEQRQPHARENVRQRLRHGDEQLHAQRPAFRGQSRRDLADGFSRFG
jgi:hypothetical protein